MTAEQMNTCFIALDQNSLISRYKLVTYTSNGDNRLWI